MNDKQTTRRRFMVSVLTFSAAATVAPAGWLASSKAWAADGDGELDQTLIDIARTLFPHDGMPDSTYGEVMSDVLASLASSEATGDVAATAEAELNSRRDRPFADLDEAEQIEVVNELQSEEFFAAFLGTVLFTFYYHPRVWQYIAYPGSSKEFGGYIDRGFDDIDWLSGDA